MRKCLIGVVGFFGNGVSTAGGQEAKTCSLTRALAEMYGKENVVTVDTFNWKHHPLRLVKQLIGLAKHSKNIFMLPAQNSVHVFVPLFVLLKQIYNCKLHYVVVGGWLPQITEKRTFLAYFARKLDGIYVETNTMKAALKKQGFSNVTVLPNFKYIIPVSAEMLQKQYQRPYKLCTFSRVMKEKGIEDAIEAVKMVNTKYNEIVLQLDIYGKIDPGYEKRFQEVTAKMPSYIQYCGMVEPEQSVEVLKDYFALLFPTHYMTEGIPGTIIDAYSAGIPVITALWENSEDVFVEGLTGWGYPLGDQLTFATLLEKIVREPDDFAAMKITSLQAAEKYCPNNAIKGIEMFIND